MSLGILIILIINCIELLLSLVLFLASFTSNIKHLVNFNYKIYWFLNIIVLVFLIIFAFITDNTMFYWFLSFLVSSSISLYFSKFVNTEKLDEIIEKFNKNINK